MLGAILGLATSFIGAKGDKKAKKKEEADAAQTAPQSQNEVKINREDLDALIQKAAVQPGKSVMTA